MDAIDAFLDRNTMYRLVISSLSVLVLIALALSFIGRISYSPAELIISLLLLLFTCYVVNAGAALLMRATPTPDSSLITGIILFFILAPVQGASDAPFLMLAAAIAMLSKYVIVYQRKHLFNPAAVAAFVLSVVGKGAAIWWIASPILLPFVLVLGLLIVRKTRQFELLFIFLGTAIVVFLSRSILSGSALVPSVVLLFTTMPIIFFGTVMLTDPQTIPTRRTDRRWFSVLTGLLFSLSFSLGTLSATPEFALLVGNLYAFFVNSKKRVELTLHETKQLSREIYEFAFLPSSSIQFIPGQYMELTSPHSKTDKRGIRRYLTISSYPNDPLVRIGVQLPVESSTFKDSLKNLQKGAKLSATMVTGEFTLPTEPTTPIAAIAGGIGITPFMSMFRMLANTHQRRDIVLFYAAMTPLDFAYKEELDSIKDSIGLRIIYIPTDFTELTEWRGHSGFITGTIMGQEVPDFKKRHWYLSGPTGMVNSYKQMIQDAGVKRGLIKTDYFPGF